MSSFDDPQPDFSPLSGDKPSQPSPEAKSPGEPRANAVTQGTARAAEGLSAKENTGFITVEDAERLAQEEELRFLASVRDGLRKQAFIEEARRLRSLELHNKAIHLRVKQGGQDVQWEPSEHAISIGNSLRPEDAVILLAGAVNRVWYSPSQSASVAQAKALHPTPNPQKLKEFLDELRASPSARPRVNYLEGRPDISVVFNPRGGSSWDAQLKEISLSGKHKRVDQIFDLLHEIGHAAGHPAIRRGNIETDTLADYLECCFKEEAFACLTGYFVKDELKELCNSASPLPLENEVRQARREAEAQARQNGWDGKPARDYVANAVFSRILKGLREDKFFVSVNLEPEPGVELLRDKKGRVTYRAYYTYYWHLLRKTQPAQDK